MSQNRVIGRDGRLPWHLPDEMAHFRRTTLGHPVIMGRKTFDSQDRKPLPKRQNIVVSRTKIEIDGIDHAFDLTSAIAIAEDSGADECFVIGGSSIYKEALYVADRLYQTIIHATFEGDTFFPDFDLSGWQQIAYRHHPIDKKHSTSFGIYKFEKI